MIDSKSNDLETNTTCKITNHFNSIISDNNVVLVNNDSNRLNKNSDVALEDIIFSFCLDKENQIKVETEMRCLSEPPSLKRNEPSNGENIFNEDSRSNLLLDKSPTLRLLLHKLIDSDNFKSPEAINSTKNNYEKNDDNTLNKLSFDDLIFLFSSNKLNFKRSFSHTKLKFDRRYIKKSLNFEKFLKNILKGKQKSNSLCNFNAKKPLNNSSESKEVNRKESTTSSTSFKDAPSTESDNLDDMIMTIMNSKHLPILKIEDSLRESSIKLDDTHIKILNADELESNQNNSKCVSIPDEIKYFNEKRNWDLDENSKRKDHLIFHELNLREKSAEKKLSDINENLNLNDSFSKHNEMNADFKNNFAKYERNEKASYDDLESTRYNKKSLKINALADKYSTMYNFTLPSFFSNAQNLKDQATASTLSPSLTFSSFSLKTKNTLNSEILPLKEVSQFKPTVNWHKRTLSPVSCSQINTSKSIDSFLTNTNISRKNEPAVVTNSSDPKIIENISTVDLTKSLPNRNKKKVSVTRSFSYNAGRLSDLDKDQSILIAASSNSNLGSSTKLANVASIKKALTSINSKIEEKFPKSLTNMASKSSDKINIKSATLNLDKMKKFDDKLILNKNNATKILKSSTFNSDVKMFAATALIKFQSNDGNSSDDSSHNNMTSESKRQSSRSFLNKKASSVFSSLPFRTSFVNDGLHGRKQSQKILKSSSDDTCDGNMICSLDDEMRNYSPIRVMTSNNSPNSETEKKKLKNLKKNESNPNMFDNELNLSNPSFFLRRIDSDVNNFFLFQDDSFKADIDEEEDKDTFNEETNMNNLSDSLLNSKFNDSSLNFLTNANTLPSKNTEEPLTLTRYGIRRHHSAPQSDAKWLQAKRKAIVVQMYDTEKSYVEALKHLVNKYYLPLKEKVIVERKLINDIFYKIPEIHVHHELLLSLLKSKFDTWDTRQTVGDILLNVFAKQSVVETYISFVNNYRTSQEAIRICKEQSSLFCKFLEQQAKDHRGKLTLKDLIIQPVQRIPRYELYVKDFLQCTPKNHPDYLLLMKAQKDLHNLAEKIDQVHKEVSETYGTDSQSALQVIQDLIENLDDLVNAYRYYIRHDVVTIISSTGLKKDRCVFFFSDLIVLTSCKRRSGNINKKTSSFILNSPLGKQYLENNKHKLINKFQLEDIELIGSSLSKKISVEKDYLEEDLITITRINELVKSLACPHQELDETINEMTTNILQKLSESSLDQSSMANNSSSNNSSLLLQSNFSTLTNLNSSTNVNSGSSLDVNDIKQRQTILTINTTERVEMITIQFGSTDQRQVWEKCYIEAKKNFFESCSRNPASFLNPIVIPSNRSGVQFICASSILNNFQNDLWICCTDGQMGQICIMNTMPDLAISSCNTLFNSAITCMQYVPAFFLKKDYDLDLKLLNRANSINTRSLATQSGDFSTHNSATKSLIDYDSSEDESESGNEETNEPSTLDDSFYNLLQNRSLENSFTSNENKSNTVWIGNEDGSLHIFQFNDSLVRTVGRKNRITKIFSNTVQSLCYMDNKVFVSLKNGDMAVFKRTLSIWNYDSYTIKTIVNEPFNSMIPVAGKLWCCHSNTILILNPISLNSEHHITIEGEKKLALAAGGTSSWAIWVASLNNLVLKLYHATKYIVLAEINIKQAIVQKLSGLDELIKLHKLSCIKITCLYVCKDTLWIGTTAGIILNVKIPHINSTTNKLNTPLTVNALNHGHVGPVRFISSIEIPKNQSAIENLNQVTSAFNKTLVLSGGEGFEEYNKSSSNVSSNQQSDSTSTGAINFSGVNSKFSSSNGNEETLVGKEDITNYVLSWEI